MPAMLRTGLPTADQASHATDVLLKSLNLLGTKGHSLRQRALANLAIGLVKAGGVDVDLPHLEKLWKQFGLGDRSTGGFKAAFEAGAELGYLTIRANTCLLTAKANAKTVEQAMTEAFPGFESELRRAWKDGYDPHFSASCRHAFVPALQLYLQHVVETSLTNGLRGAVSADILVAEFEKVAARFGVPNGRDYAELLTIWIRGEPDALADVASSMYTMTATLALFSAHGQMAAATMQTLRGTSLCLDANLLVQLLCPKTSTWHRSTLEIISLAGKLGISLFTLDTHVDEVRKLVQATQRTFSAGQTTGDWITKDNQLIHEVQARRGEGVQGILGAFARFEALLHEHGIEVRPLDRTRYPADDDVVNAIHNLLNATGNFREPGAVDRDASAVHYIRSLQDERGGPIPNPWLLTFDNKLVGGEHLVRQTSGGTAVSIHAATWLVGVGGMLEVDGSGIDVSGVAAAWLSLGFVPLERITAGEVVEVLSFQVDMPEEVRAEFVRNCLRSHLLREIDWRLRRRAYAEIPPIVDDLVKEATGLMGKSLATQIKESARLRETIQRMAQEKKSAGAELPPPGR